MKIRKFKTLKEAIEKSTRESENFIFVRHTLNAKGQISLHYHNKANEFIVIDRGRFKVRLEDEEKIFDLKNQPTVIFFPRKKKHSLLALGTISYFVFRDTKDTTIYC